MKWSFFFGAAVIAGYLLLNHGAPWFAVLLGIVLAAMFNWRSHQKSARTGRSQ